MDFNIVEISNEHISQIISIHLKSFPNFFLSFLGPRFLKEFYKSFLYDPAGKGFVAEDAKTGEVLGVVVGSLEPKGYFKRLLKKKWYVFCLASTTAIFKSPRIVTRLFRALFYRGDPPSGLTRSLLSSIAVLPRAQGYGIGKALVKRWVEEVEKHGYKGCYLTTDAYNNEKVIGFYQKLGWKLESTYKTPQGRVMNRYILNLLEKDK